MNSGASVDVGRIFSWCASGPGIPPTLDLEEGETFYDVRDKIVRRQPSWQRSRVVSQQRLRLRRLALVNRVPKLRFQPVLFLFLACFSIIKYRSIETAFYQRTRHEARKSGRHWFSPDLRSCANYQMSTNSRRIEFIIIVSWHTFCCKVL